MKHCYLYRTLTSSFLLFALILVASEPAWARSKLDVLTMNNGDHITCEIIRLERGYLYVKLDYGEGTISLNWSKVALVDSPQQFIVTDQSGRRSTATLQKFAVKAGQPEEQVASKIGVPQINRAEVVEIDRSDVDFWRNQHGSIDFGLNFAKQSNRTQYSLNADDTFNRERWSASANLISSLATGGGSDLRNDLVFQGGHQLRSPHNLAIGYSEFLQSNEQDLDLRTTLGGGLGHFFQYTNSARILVLAGFVLDRERYSSGPRIGHSASSAEAMIGTQVNFFRFKTTNILGAAQVYPSITDAGRVRLDANASSRLRIARHLYSNTGYYLNYDSRPPSNTPQTDYGLSSGLGWTF
jgi:putative salt-induced outer membrane protein YdiY